MPTGYTHQIIDGDVKTPKEFILTCARAFGGFYHLRDSSFDGPVTEKDMKYSSDGLTYHKKELSKAKAKRTNLLKLSTSKKKEKAKIEIEKKLNSYKKSLLETESNNRVFKQFREKIWNWNTIGDIENIKNFAISQLDMSIDNTDFYKTEINKLAMHFLDPMAYFLNVLLESANWNVNYHQEQIEKELDNAKKMEKWYSDFKTCVETLK